MFKMRGCVWALLGLLFACSDTGESKDVPPVDTRVHLFLTDFPIDNADVKKVLVTFTHIEVYSAAQESWLTVVDYGQAGRTFDLLTLQGGLTEELGAFNLEPGTYDQIRLYLKADNEIELDEGQGVVRLPLKVPSGEQTGIKLVREFTVSGEGPTEIVVDFNAEKSVKKTGHGWQLAPTIKIVSVSTADWATRIVGPAGGTVRLLNEGQVEIPAGALSHETEITIRSKEISPQRAAEQGLYPSSLVEFGPHGLTFARPVRVTLWYSPEEITGVPLSALTFLAEENGAWTELPGTFDTELGTISAEMTHFSHAGLGNSVESVVLPTNAPAPLMPGESTVFEVKLYGADCDVSQLPQVPCDELEAREVVWQSQTPSLLDVQTGDTSCAQRSSDVACQGGAPYCYWTDVFGCVDSKRFGFVSAVRYSGARVNITVPRTVAGASLFFPVYGFQVTFHDMYVISDGDDFSEGELYWWLNVNGQTWDHRDEDHDDGDTIGVGVTTTPYALSVNDTLSVSADVREDDGGLNGGTDSTSFSHTYSASSNWGIGFWNANTDQGDSDPDVDVRYSISPYYERH